MLSAKVHSLTFSRSISLLHRGWGAPTWERTRRSRGFQRWAQLPGSPFASGPMIGDPITQGSDDRSIVDHDLVAETQGIV
jgi:hypothetical protein